jgi:hypothetical protein
VVEKPVRRIKTINNFFINRNSRIYFFEAGSYTLTTLMAAKIKNTPAISKA